MGRRKKKQTQDAAAAVQAPSQLTRRANMLAWWVHALLGAAHSTHTQQHTHHIYTSSRRSHHAKGHRPHCLPQRCLAIQRQQPLTTASPSIPSKQPDHDIMTMLRVAACCAGIFCFKTVVHAPSSSSCLTTFHTATAHPNAPSKASGHATQPTNSLNRPFAVRVTACCCGLALRWGPCECVC